MNKKRRSGIYAILILLIVCSVFYFTKSTEIKEVSISDFEQDLYKGNIVSITVVKDNNSNTFINYTDKNEEAYKTVIFDSYLNVDSKVYNYIEDNNVAVSTEKVSTSVIDRIDNFTSALLLITLIVVGLSYLQKLNSIDIEYVKDEQTRFNDVGGLSETKREISQIINYLNNSEQMKQYTNRIPKGILFEGEPGNGKTLMAKLIAGESKTPFMYISASELEGSYVAQGAGKVSKLFKSAKKIAKKEGKVILFIDELDAIGGNRIDNKQGSVYNLTINKLLTELDGFSKNSNILVIGATNLVEKLDPALIRSGRFDRVIKINKPNQSDREEILNLYVNKKLEKFNRDIFDNDYIHTLSLQTEGFNSSDLDRLISDSLLIAFEDNSKVSIAHLREAYLRIVIGLPSNTTRSLIENEIIAYHEAAHAILHMKLNPLGYKGFVYGTIEQYGEGGGHVSLVRDSSIFTTKNDYLNLIKVLLAGRAIEDKLTKGNFTDGARNDLKKVSDILTDYIFKDGMDDELQNIYIDKLDKESNWIQSKITQLRDELYKETLLEIDLEFANIENLAHYLLEHKSIELTNIKEMFEQIYPSKVN